MITSFSTLFSTTLILYVAEILFEVVAVITALPLFMNDTTPSLLTVATELLLEIHLTDLLEVFIWCKVGYQLCFFSNIESIFIFCIWRSYIN